MYKNILIKIKKFNNIFKLNQIILTFCDKIGIIQTTLKGKNWKIKYVKGFKVVEMNKQYDLAILGAGSAGLVACATARGLGASVLLVENRKMGGDCLNYGCVPSKTFLKSCKTMKTINHSSDYGILVGDVKPSLEKIMERVQSVIDEIAPHDSVERFRGLGADVVLGHGEILSKNSVKVGDEIYGAKKIIISTGSTANLPPIQGLENVKYYTNESIFSLKTLPKRLVVLGSGPIGLELGQGFSLLGSEVHIIDRGEKLFSKDEPEVSGIMTKALEDDGLNLHFKCKIISVLKENDEIIVCFEQDGQTMQIACDTLLVALGRTPNTKDIGLENVGIKTNDRGYIEVNEKLQTSVSNIYACGDSRGKFMFTHMAGYEAVVAVKNALISPRFKTSYLNVAWTTYTSPEVAHVGAMEKDVQNDGGYAHFIEIDDNDRAKAENDRIGFVKLVLDKKRRVIGGTIVGEKAGEMLTQVSLMVAHKMPLTSALNVIYQYPIQGEIIKTLATRDFKDHVKPWQQSLIQKIVKRG